MEVMKKVKIGFSSLYQEGRSKIYSLERVRLLGMGEGIPQKKGQKQMGEWSIAEEKNSKKFFLIVYFNLRFSIYAVT